MISNLLKIWTAKRNILIILLLAFLYISCSPNKPSSNISEFYNFPNPFSPSKENTTYKVSIASGEIISAKVEIYSQNGDLMDTKTLTNRDKTTAACIWSGLDKNGKYLPSAVYNAKVIVKDNQDSTFIAEFKTSIR
ncbi:hypothetical protein OFR29_11840 [Brachyspira hyodysenteriae]|uniref:FlgD immunoglobulin-like domain containing protein n=1 Tax=Brachyspira hyodysenteriae TaxID=159 RepID=UPI0022CD57FC|nr:FlgD immunoglobulin-like domain containing protein [Brachyspira hyodysenteriae]MCZ9839656.1 hypothetical protein [Brachyspira hyodysenteriae]MCZ9847297.1 hypothetical protein [Brachyspira hyodysenteriae]MCZ9873001.1 hypothetical protein [Brachyspira hyodysenteriae]MCZ9892966.1 hypothetical protein [Brachyspira hyodysenteriae]MCZ9930682.1 hypothetical protein [Brachyspira hyodysenteriae]